MTSPIKYEREQRFHWYLRIDKHGKTLPEVCKIFGISHKTYYKWRRRNYGQKGNTYVPSKGHGRYPKLQTHKFS